MKRLQWMALLAAMMMAFTMTAASAATISYFPNNDGDTGVQVLWLLVPWEDEGRDVLFGIRFNENREAMSGVRVEIDILQKDTEAWKARYDMLDAEYQAVAEEKGLMLMDINLSKPKAASSNQAEPEYEPYTADDLNLTMYIHGRDAWDQEKVRFCFIAEDKDEVFSRTMLEDVYYGSQFEGYDASGKYLSVDMKHFSPFVVFNEGEAKTPPTPTPAPPSAAPGIAAPPTGDGAQPVLWASVLLMGLAAIGMMIASSRKAKE